MAMCALAALLISISNVQIVVMTLFVSDSTDGGSQKKKTSSQRWSKLLDLKKTLDKAPK